MYVCVQQTYKLFVPISIHRQTKLTEGGCEQSWLKCCPKLASWRCVLNV